MKMFLVSTNVVITKAATFLGFRVGDRIKAPKWGGPGGSSGEVFGVILALGAPKKNSRESRYCTYFGCRPGYPSRCEGGYDVATGVFGVHLPICVMAPKCYSTEGHGGG